MTIFGPKWPLTKGNSDCFDLYEDVASQINYYIKSIILTSPGENMSDMEYGVGIRRYLFEQNIDSTRSSLQTKIERQIYRYIPYINVNSVEVNASDSDIDAGSMNVRISYYIPERTTQEVFSLDVTAETKIGFY